MPQRFLRPGIRTSEAWNCTSFRAQSLYIGILTLVDDYGRYDGRPALLHAEIFCLRDDVTRQDTAADIRELGEQGLVQLYEVDGKVYLQVTRWQERTRNPSRFPAPPAVIRLPTAANGSQRQPTAASPTSTSTSSSSPTSTSTSSIPQANGAKAPAVPTALVEEIYQAYPRKEGREDALRAIRKRIKEGKDPQFLLERVKTYAAAIAWKERDFIPHPATWFNNGRYDDDPANWKDPGRDIKKHPNSSTQKWKEV